MIFSNILKDWIIENEKEINQEIQEWIYQIFKFDIMITWIVDNMISSNYLFDLISLIERRFYRISWKMIWQNEIIIWNWIKILNII